MKTVVPNTDDLTLALRVSDSVVSLIYSFHLTLVCGSVCGLCSAGDAVLLKSRQQVFCSVSSLQPSSPCLRVQAASSEHLDLPHLLLLSVFQLVDPSSASWQEEEVGGKRHVPHPPRGLLPSTWRGAAAVQKQCVLAVFSLWCPSYLGISKIVTFQ